MGKIFIVRHGQDTDNAAGILNGRRWEEGLKTPYFDNVGVIELSEN